MTLAFRAALLKPSGSGRWICASRKRAGHCEHLRAAYLFFSREALILLMLLIGLGRSTSMASEDGCLPTRTFHGKPFAEWERVVSEHAVNLKQDLATVVLGMQAIAASGPDAKRLAPSLRRILAVGNAVERMAACMALIEIGDASDETVKIAASVYAGMDSDRTEAPELRWLLQSIAEGGSRPAVQAMLELLAVADATLDQPIRGEDSNSATRAIELLVMLESLGSGRVEIQSDPRSVLVRIVRTGTEGFIWRVLGLMPNVSSAAVRREIINGARMRIGKVAKGPLKTALLGILCLEASDSDLCHGEFRDGVRFLLKRRVPEELTSLAATSIGRSEIASWAFSTIDGTEEREAVVELLRAAERRSELVLTSSQSILRIARSSDSHLSIWAIEMMLDAGWRSTAIVESGTKLVRIGGGLPWRTLERGVRGGDGTELQVEIEKLAHSDDVSDRMIAARVAWLLGAEVPWVRSMLRVLRCDDPSWRVQSTVRRLRLRSR